MATDLLQLLPRQDRDQARERSMPDWMDPMLAKLTHDYFTGEDWIFERKLDGERVIAYIDPSGQVRLMSRNRHQLNDTYPEIDEALRDQAPAGCIVDGEVVAFNADNVTDFQRLQPRMQASSREEARASGVKVYYYIFDCLYIDGHDITACTLRSRKKLLKAAINWDDPLRWTPHRNDDGLDYYREACRKGWEGLIAKHAGSEYVHGRSNQWVKFKCVAQQEFVICGFTEPHGKRIAFGALLLGFYRHGNLVYAGEVGTGFDNETLKALRDRLDGIERKTSPYDQGRPQTKEVHFVSPQLRHPRYKGLRRDKDPQDVHKEAESQKADL
jgi:bifunctional non-homologous end joining protein LigD